jgi:hypothetical protein
MYKASEGWNDHLFQVPPELLEKFAELIVQDCAIYCEGHILPKGMAEENGLNYNDGVTDCAIGLKHHFGVEE